jgi:outer membrane protein
MRRWYIFLLVNNSFIGHVFSQESIKDQGIDPLIVSSQSWQGNDFPGIQMKDFSPEELLHTLSNRPSGRTREEKNPSGPFVQESHASNRKDPFSANAQEVLGDREIIKDIAFRNVVCHPKEWSQNNPLKRPVKCLEEALRAAYYQNEKIALVRVKLKKIAERLAQVNANWKPDVSLNLGKQNNLVREIDGDKIVRGQYGQRNQVVNAGFEAVQSLYSGGSTVIEASRLSKEYTATKEELNATVQEIFFQVVQSYAELWSAILKCVVHKMNKDDLKRLVAFVQARDAVGSATRADVCVAQSKFASAASYYAAAQADVVTRRANLEHLIGIAIDPNLGKIKPFPKVGSSIAQVCSRSFKNNPSLCMAKCNLEAARMGVDLAVAQYGGRVDLSVQGTQSWASQKTYIGAGDQLGLGNNRELSVGIKGKLTLDSQGVIASRYREAYQSVKEAMINLKGMQRQTASLVESIWQDYQSANDRTRANHEAVSASEIALQGVQAEYELGAKTIYDVLQVQGDWLVSHISYIDTLYHVVQQSYRLLQVQGLLTPKTLGLPLNYDADVYRRDVQWAPWTWTASTKDKGPFDDSGIQDGFVSGKNKQAQGSKQGTFQRSHDGKKSKRAISGASQTVRLVKVAK